MSVQSLIATHKKLTGAIKAFGEPETTKDNSEL
jgi:hypothetical protein